MLCVLKSSKCDIKHFGFSKCCKANGFVSCKESWAAGQLVWTSFLLIFHMAVCNACLGVCLTEHEARNADMESISRGLLIVLPDGWGLTHFPFYTSMEMASRGEVNCSCQVIRQSQSIHHISFFLFSLALSLTSSLPGRLESSVHDVHFLSLRQVDAKWSQLDIKWMGLSKRKLANNNKSVFVIHWSSLMRWIACNI